MKIFSRAATASKLQIRLKLGLALVHFQKHLLLRTAKILVVHTLLQQFSTMQCVVLAKLERTLTRCNFYFTMKLENCSTLIDILSSNSIKKLYRMKIIFSGPEEWFKSWQGHLYMVGIMPERIYNPITAMGFSATFTFQLDNTKR